MHLRRSDASGAIPVRGLCSGSWRGGSIGLEGAGSRPWTVAADDEELPTKSEVVGAETRGRYSAVTARATRACV